jgi:cupin 2 domain-containing protein
MNSAQQHRKGDLLADLPLVANAAQMAEVFQQLAGNPASGVRIERIVSNGHASPDGFWYDQDQHEWVMLVQGEAVLALEGQPDVHLRAGEYLNIPAHVRHRVVRTAQDQTTVWLAVFY